MAKPTQAEAEEAVRVLIEWAGDDPSREGLVDTPGRVARSYRELFAGYAANPRDYLKRTFEEVGGYDELVVLRDIRVVSFCEHHMLPVIGSAITEVIDRHGALSAAEIAEHIKATGRDINNRTVSFALQALKKRGLAKNTDGKWSLPKARGRRAGASSEASNQPAEAAE